MRKYLAIDFGLKRVGLALNREWLAEPYKVVERNRALSEIGQVIKEENIEVLLVGVADGPIAEEAKHFAKELHEVYTLPIEEVDETLSTKESDQKVRSSGMSQSDRRLPRDHYAAATFLQEFLDVHGE